MDTLLLHVLSTLSATAKEPPRLRLPKVGLSKAGTDNLSSLLLSPRVYTPQTLIHLFSSYSLLLLALYFPGLF